MNLEVLLEAERRGILPPDKVEMLAEARKRGLVPPLEQPQPNTNPGVAPEAPPDMILNPNTGQYTSRELLSGSMAQDMSGPKAFAVGGGQGVTLGGIDEIGGALNAIIPGEGTMSERNTFGREATRAQMDAARQSHPGAALSGELAGGVSLALTPLGTVGTLGPTAGLTSRIAASGAAGGGIGATQGFLSGEGGEDRMDRAKWGAGIGAGVGMAAPLLGAGGQKIADRVTQNRAIRAAAENAPTTEQLRAMGQAAYREIDDAGVRVRPDRVRDAMDEISAYLKSEGAGYTGAEKVMPSARSIMDAAGDVGGQANTVPFEELDMFRRYMGNAAAANPANRGDTRAATEAIGKLDDFINQLGPNDVDAGDIRTLQEALPKARDLWARMSRSQTIDDAIGASEDYLSGQASGIRNQFARILKSPALSRGFTDAEKAVLRRVVNGSIPQQALNLLGGGMGQIMQMGAGWGAGGPVGAMIGMATGAGFRKASESVARKNAEIARAIIANGGMKQLPVASESTRQIIEALTRRSGTAAVQ